MYERRPELGDRVVVLSATGCVACHGRIDMVDRSVFDWWYGVVTDDGAFLNVPEQVVRLESPLEALASALERT
jgi:cytochrome c1